MVECKKNRIIWKIIGLIFVSFIVFITTFVFIGCSDRDQLSSEEKKFSGEWKLDRIKYGYVDDTFKFRFYEYPSGISKFDSLCEKYIEKTVLTFDGVKKRGKNTAELIVGSKKTNTEWQVDQTGIKVNFSEALKFDSFNGTDTYSKAVSFAMLDSRNQLIFNCDDVMYIFILK